MWRRHEVANQGKISTLATHFSFPTEQSIDCAWHGMAWLTPDLVQVDEQGNITESCFKTFGCGSAIASSSVATEWYANVSDALMLVAVCCIFCG